MGVGGPGPSGSSRSRGCFWQRAIPGPRQPAREAPAREAPARAGTKSGEAPKTAGAAVVRGLRRQVSKDVLTFRGSVPRLFELRTRTP